jgi:hypothetical protein
VIGSRFCTSHGGRLKRKPVRITNLPKFYSVHLSKTLQEAVEEALDSAPEDQLNLYEELAVMRASAADICKMYDACPNDKTRMAAGGLLRDTMQEVARLCESAARVRASANDKLSIHNLSVVIAQVVRCAWEVFGDDEERAQQFEDLIREKVRMPEETRGTSITPDQDVMDMDASVPGGENGEG